MPNRSLLAWPAHRATACGALLGLALGAACGRDTVDRQPTAVPPAGPDTTPVPPAPPAPTPLGLTIADVVPRTDTITRVGVEFRADVTGTLNWSAVVVVDSGTPAETRLPLLGAEIGYASTMVFGAAFTPSAGRHRFTIELTEFVATVPRRRSASFERTFVLDDAPYVATRLPDLGYGGDAATVTASGTVAGWVADASGRRKPAVWRAGRLEIVPAPDTIDVMATGVNAAGDVLLQYDSARAGMRSARVRRPDGTELLVSEAGACCTIAADLTESRRALGTTPFNFYSNTAAVLDVATGTAVDVSVTGTLVLNDAGQRAGAIAGGYGMAGRDLQTVGFTAPPPPAGYTVTICDRPHRFSRLVPVALDDAGNLLASYCGNLVMLPQGAPSEFVDRHLGRTDTVRLARRGGLLASLDTAGTVRLWRLGSDRTARVVITGNGWRIDGLGAVNASGAIAVHGIDRATGRGGPLLLTPSAGIRAP